MRKGRIKRLVLDLLRERFFTPEIVRDLLEGVSAAIQSREDDTPKRLKTLDREIQKAGPEIGKLAAQGARL